MFMKKITLASLILFSLTACSGSGGGSNVKSPNQKITEQKQGLKDKADKAKTDAERLAKEKSEKAKAEAERLAKEAEKAKAEAERLAKEKVEKAKTEAEHLAQEKAEKAKAEAERLAKEAEKAKAEAERLAKEKAEKEKTEEQKIIDAKGGIDNKQMGLSEIPAIKEDDAKKETYGSLYNQKYSVVKAQMVRTEENLSNMNSIVEVKGLNTEKLPTEGKATYNGTAFDAHGDKGVYAGSLTYNVNFAERTGSGKIINKLDGSIDLDKGNIDHGLISSTAHHRKGEHTQSGRYEVQFFGPNAEEIGGKVEIKDGERTDRFGISGTRGEIQK